MKARRWKPELHTVFSVSSLPGEGGTGEQWATKDPTHRKRRVTASFMAVSVVPILSSAGKLSFNLSLHQLLAL